MPAPNVKRAVHKIVLGTEQTFVLDHENVNDPPLLVTIHYVRGNYPGSKNIAWTAPARPTITGRMIEIKSTPTEIPLPAGVMNPMLGGGDGTVTIVITNPPDNPGGPTTTMNSPAIPVIYT